LYTKLIAKQYNLVQKRYDSPKITAVLRFKGYTILEK